VQATSSQWFTTVGRESATPACFYDSAVSTLHHKSDGYHCQKEDSYGDKGANN
jgi:hypothetical protein